MQLTRVAVFARFVVTLLAFAAFAAFAAPARAQTATFDTAHTIFYEAPSRSHMLVYTPGVNLEVAPFDWLAVRGGWDADVVSGASVAVKAGSAYAATHPGADVITGASVHDFRNSAHGGLTLKNGNVSLTGGYAFSTEHDYRSNAIDISARTDLFEHDTQLELSYARAFDKVCDRTQATSDPAPRWRALEDSIGCFTSSNPLRASLPVDIDGFQASWSQAWTPIFATQLVYTAQLVNGFQSNPYRSVILADGLKAQEHEPDNRGRSALALRGNLFIKPIRAALRGSIRGYSDTWRVRSGTVEAEFEKYFGERFRAMVRGRLYAQRGAIFWSDDYTGGDPPLGPKGQYWTGDRELSPFWSWMLGLRATYTITPSTPGKRILGLMTSLRFTASADVVDYNYSEFTLAGVPLSNTRSYLGALDLTATF